MPALPQNAYILAYSAWTYQGSGKEVQAEPIRERLIAKAQTQYVPATALAITRLQNDADSTFEKLEEAWERREPILRYALWQSFALRDLHSDDKSETKSGTDQDFGRLRPQWV